MKIPFHLKLSFGIGQLAFGTMSTALSVFLLFYYNQVLGLSGAMAGTAIGLSVMVDAVTDPLTGSLSDHWRSRLGRRHPFMYASILPLAISFYFLFNPLVDSQTGLFIWLLVFANATRTSMSLYNIPHMALGAEITEDFHDRSALVGFRYFFQSAGILLCLALGFGVFFVPTTDFENGQMNAAAYPPFALALSFVMVGVIFWAAWGTRSVIRSLPQIPDEPPVGVLGAIARVFTDLMSSLRSASFRWLFAGMMNIYAVLGANYALELYMLGYFWELDGVETLVVFIAIPIGSLIGSFLAPAVIGKLGRRAALSAGVLAFAFLQTIPVALRLLGFFPENGHYLLVPLLLGAKGLQGLCIVNSDVSYGSMMADIVDEHELASGERQEGIFFAATYFAGKSTGGLGAMIAGFALDFIEWPVGPEIKTAADVPIETIFELGIFYGPMTASFGFLSFWCFSHYTLTHERHTEILAQLVERRGSRVSAS